MTTGIETFNAFIFKMFDYAYGVWLST